jgi:hypothetical protein
VPCFFTLTKLTLIETLSVFNRLGSLTNMEEKK